MRYAKLGTTGSVRRGGPRPRRRGRADRRQPVADEPVESRPRLRQAVASSDELISRMGGGP
jgi:hypothetical protein